MIIDITGTELIPGNLGKDCPSNGNYYDSDGSLIECCCDECDYMMCCLPEHNSNMCKKCSDQNCPLFCNENPEKS